MPAKTQYFMYLKCSRMDSWIFHRKWLLCARENIFSLSLSPKTTEYCCLHYLRDLLAPATSKHFRKETPPIIGWMMLGTISLQMWSFKYIKCWVLSGISICVIPTEALFSRGNIFSLSLLPKTTEYGCLYCLFVTEATHFSVKTDSKRGNLVYPQGICQLHMNM